MLSKYTDTHTHLYIYICVCVCVCVCVITKFVSLNFSLGNEQNSIKYSTTFKYYIQGVSEILVSFLIT